MSLPVRLLGRISRLYLGLALAALIYTRSKGQLKNIINKSNIISIHFQD
jgi:hypothetical protein